MASELPLTRFLIALSHSPELLERFKSGERGDLLAEWGVADNELFREGELTLERVQEHLNKEHADRGGRVEVAWWILIFGPPPRPDWVWGIDDDGDELGGTGGGGYASTQ